MTDKVKDAKDTGVVIEEKPAESVGVAKTETEETTLKKNAETKVDEQIKALEEDEKRRRSKTKESK